MSELTQHLVFLGAALFCLGTIGFLTRRSLILMFLSLELMLSGVSVCLIAFSREHNNYQGQVLAIMVLTVAACEAAIALALIVSLFRRRATLDVQLWSDLNETPAPTVSETPVRLVEPPQHFPSLTPAGLDPAENPIPAEIEKLGWKQNESEPSRAAEEIQHA